MLSSNLKAKVCFQKGSVFKFLSSTMLLFQIISKSIMQNWQKSKLYNFETVHMKLKKNYF